MHGFLSSLADKAQSAINATPLAHRPAEADAEHKSHTLGAISNQLRVFGQQYASTSPVQKIITIEKSVAIDFESIARDAKSQSKELYTWGQAEPADLMDVTDRLAYINFVQGSLASSLASKLDAARAPFKALRDAETAIAPRRNLRAGLQSQIARVEHDQQRGYEKKIAELKEQIHKAELDDQPQEKEIELLKRKAVRESEKLKWEAFREYGEKLVLLSQASAPIVGALPILPPTPQQPYTGAQATGAARASLQRALDNYKTGHINLTAQLSGADLHRSDTRSFGESHADELSSINSDVTHISSPAFAPSTPPSDYKTHSAQPPPPFKPSDAHSADKPSSLPPINLAALNQTPTPIPATGPAGPTLPIPIPGPSASSAHPPITPTLAETGVPVSARTGGPGPASGSLHDIRRAASNAGPRDETAPIYGQLPTDTSRSSWSTTEEKRKLEATYSQPSASEVPLLVPQSSSASHYESAEEEKKRLEREERERVLSSGSSTHKDTKDQDDLPPSYQEL
ncbi:Sphingolipid long chain base-responsive protein LSP1 [Termitomyces sp. J132]|nr:hypothetical protein H2248_000794 [Termitomyces sp. 'cryptogamus']KNZ71409.1 Sphingolipid long chain base-responsive protein LSP1 [Termitomyces sp. J132]